MFLKRNAWESLLKEKSNRDAESLLERFVNSPHSNKNGSDSARNSKMIISWTDKRHKAQSGQSKRGTLHVFSLLRSRSDFGPSLENLRLCYNVEF